MFHKYTIIFFNIIYHDFRWTNLKWLFGQNCDMRIAFCTNSSKNKNGVAASFIEGLSGVKNRIRRYTKAYLLLKYYN